MVNDVWHRSDGRCRPRNVGAVISTRGLLIVVVAGVVGLMAAWSAANLACATMQVGLPGRLTALVSATVAGCLSGLSVAARLNRLVW